MNQITQQIDPTTVGVIKSFPSGGTIDSIILSNDLAGVTVSCSATLLSASLGDQETLASLSKADPGVSQAMFKISVPPGSNVKFINGGASLIQGIVVFTLYA